MNRLCPAPERSPLLQPFYPALDGLRAVAVFLVFNYHFTRLVSNAYPLRWGWAGVDLFFVLSGFLITGILYDSIHRPDYFRNFYIRRVLRIFPVFYGIWLAFLLLTPVLHVQWNRYVASMALYFGNLLIPGAREHLHADPGTLLYRSFRHPGLIHGILVDHFWSLCVEEQFYLVWPAVVCVLRSRRALLSFCFGWIVLAPFGRTLYLHLRPEMLANGALYYTTFARADTLLFGAVVALWLRGPTPSAATVRRIAWSAALGSPALLALFLLFEKTPSPLPALDPVVSTVGFSLIALTGCGLLLLSLDPLSPLAQILRWSPLARMGRISYGFYAYHQLLAVGFSAYIGIALRHHLGFMVPLLAFVTTYVLAWLSFRFWESPFLRMKHVLAPRPGAIPDPPPAGESPRPEGLASL